MPSYPTHLDHRIRTAVVRSIPIRTVPRRAVEALVARVAKEGLSDGR